MYRIWETIEILPITELGMWQAESMEIKFMNDNDYSKLTRLQTAVQFMMPERKVFEQSMESFGFLEDQFWLYTFLLQYSLMVIV